MTKGKNDGAKKQRPREKASNEPQNALIPADTKNTHAFAAGHR